MNKPSQAPTKGKPGPRAQTPAKPAAKRGSFFSDWINRLGLRELLKDETEQHTPDVIVEEADVIYRHKRLVALIGWQSIAIGALMVILVFGAPLMQPSFHFFARSPDKNMTSLSALGEPNLTNQAVLSWAATSITEIMTLGFGDFDRQLIMQRKRFTGEGWDSFLKALFQQGVRDAFKKQQLVLTTVPADAPVIVAQGDTEEGEYIWKIEMPIIMTYTTHNNVTQKSHAVIRLTIVRVPPRVNTDGIAIKSWNLA